jgi:hypothetical protein
MEQNESGERMTAGSDPNEKFAAPQTDLPATMNRTLEAIQTNLFERARQG